LAYPQQVETDEAAIQNVLAKKEVAVFAPIRHNPGRPGYGSLEALQRLFQNRPDVRRPGTGTDV
jgi:hypothetical protein